MNHDPPVSASEKAPPEPSTGSGKRRWSPRLTLPGCWGALLLACLSFTPSLLPRGAFSKG